MPDLKSTAQEEELKPEQRKFLAHKQEQKTRDVAAGSELRSDRGEFLKSARQKKEEQKAAQAAVQPEPEPITRREFLNYAWGAAMGVVLAEAGIATFMFALPRFKEGQFGGAFALGTANTMPTVGAAPVSNLDGGFWLVNDDDGVRALYRVCTHLGCLYEWKDQTQRFECPCHGSKFQHSGKYIEGPAPRSLDQFEVRLEDGGQVLAQTGAGGDGVAIVDPNATVVVDTGKKLLGPRH